MRKFMLEYIGPMERALAIVDAQAGHGSVVAGKHYAVQAANAYQIDAETLSRFFLCSVSWYKVVMGDESLSEATRDSYIEADAQAQGQARNHLIHPPHNPDSCLTEVMDLIHAENRKLADQLRAGILADSTALARTQQVSAAPAPIKVHEWHRQLLAIVQGDKDANWTCQGQGEAIAHILKRDTSLLVVLPTGFGKSFLFLGAAIAAQGVSVVVTPFKALLDSHLRAAHAKGLEALKYEFNPQLTHTTRLVFVSAENAARPSFKAWCQRLQADDLLLRVFFDEAHEALTGQLYRDVLKQMQLLVELDVPVIAMTASLPPSLEPDLRREVGGPNWVIVREKTQRKNLHFRTALFRHESDMQHSLGEHLRVYTQQLRPNEGIMVQCRTVDQVETLAGRFETAMYYSEYEHAAESAASWLSGETPVIICTSGLGTGVHHPACRVVIHYGLGYGLMGYIQETGRAGRDSLPSLCLLFHTMNRPPPPKSRDNPSPNDVRYNGWTELVEMAEGTKCQRLVMSEWADGPVLRVSCASGDYSPCGNCREMRALADEDPVSFIMVSQTQFNFDAQARPRKVYTRTEIVERKIPRSLEQIQVEEPEDVEGSAGWHQDPIMEGPPAVLIDSPPNSPPRKQLRREAIDEEDPIGSFSSPPRPIAGPSTRKKLQNTRIAQTIDLGGRAPAVGPLVKIDASRARATAAAARTAAYAPEPGSNMDLILRMKEKFSHRCMICLIDRGIDQCSGHTVTSCPPGVHKGYGLPMHEIGDWTLESAKSGKTMKLRRGAGICFYCLWPDYAHASDAEKPNCDGGDVLYPLCWLIFRHEDYRWKMIEGFNLAPDISVQAYWVWLGMADPVEKLHGPHPFSPTCPFINAHKVAIWFIFSYRRFLKRKESAEWYQAHRPQNSYTAGSRVSTATH
ncbi:hypothetical protein FS749_012398 [Ceratobasidium sp. UAMH 11750]|nr:hypothetical protein FS749_012398 [Ceratobasidium sp. UAMH 11750]